MLSDIGRVSKVGLFLRHYYNTSARKLKLDILYVNICKYIKLYSHTLLIVFSVLSLASIMGLSSLVYSSALQFIQSGNSNCSAEELHNKILKFELACFFTNAKFVA